MIDEIEANLNATKEKKDIVNFSFQAGHFRSCLSALYYYCFYYVRALLLTKGLQFKSHKATLIYFNKEFVKTSVFPTDTGSLLQKLFECRQGSDYDLIKYGEEFVKQLIEDAEKFTHVADDYIKKYLNS